MVCSCGNFQNAADRQFTTEKAAKELQAYQKGHLGPTTRLMCDSGVGRIRSSRSRRSDPPRPIEFSNERDQKTSRSWPITTFPP
jgi:hypothetical protein